MTDLEFISDVLPHWPINCIYELNAWQGTAVITWRYCGFNARATFWLALIDHLDAGHPTSINLTVDVPDGTAWRIEPNISYEDRRELGGRVRRYHAAGTIQQARTCAAAEAALAAVGFELANLVVTKAAG